MNELYEVLTQKFGDKPIAANSASTLDLGENWRCPVCDRAPIEFAVLNRNDEILCSVHWHHDHARDLPKQLCRDYSYCGCWGAWLDSVGDSISRFFGVEVCSFCNEAEGKAKQAVKADKYFSFTPLEMREFISAKEGGPVFVDCIKASRIHDRVKAAGQHRFKICKRMVELAIEGTIGVDGHPFQPMAPGIPRNLRELDCDGSYKLVHLAKKHGLA